MQWLIDLLHNPYLVTGLSSWFIAQVLKTILYAIVHKKMDWKRLFGDGGMPSGHSATVSSLAAICALLHGTGSFQFAATCILAVIVCHDAMGVRLETGKQAAVLNDILEFFRKLSEEDELPEVKLKEFVGHTPTQVLVGILLGLANALVMYFLVFNLG
jgi:acid phosphatase family membrane protein YuiD